MEPQAEPQRRPEASRLSPEVTWALAAQDRAAWLKPAMRIGPGGRGRGVARGACRGPCGSREPVVRGRSPCEAVASAEGVFTPEQWAGAAPPDLCLRRAGR